MAAFVESFVIHLIKLKISDLEGYTLTGNIIKSSNELIKNYTLLLVKYIFIYLFSFFCISRLFCFLLYLLYNDIY